MNEPKPWDKETCRRRYIEGDRITYDELAKVSGRSIKVIGQWAAEDKKRGYCWPETRKEWTEKLQTKTAEKTLEQLSTQRAQILVDHYNAAQQFSYLAQKMAETQLVVLQERIDEYESGDVKAAQSILKELTAISKEASLWMGILDRAIGKEREALGLDQQNINIALKTVTSAGFEVTNVATETMRKYLEAEGYRVIPPPHRVLTNTDTVDKIHGNKS